MCRRAGRLARVAPHPNHPRHHVLGDSDPDVAVDDDLRPLVHPRAVVAGMAADPHLDGVHQADRERVPPHGVEHLERRLRRVAGAVLEPLVERADVD